MNLNKIRLSILICSLYERKEKLNRLLSILESQKNDSVEIIVETDNRQITTGRKRNNLLAKSSGDYIVFVDDDDLVSSDYIKKICDAIKSNPDCVGIEGVVKFESKNIVRKFVHSIKYNSWFTKDDVYYRCPNHISPVKRELALKAMFDDITIGEDIKYSYRLFKYLKSEVYIDGPIYCYLTK